MIGPWIWDAHAMHSGTLRIKFEHITSRWVERYFWPHSQSLYEFVGPWISNFDHLDTRSFQPHWGYLSSNDSLTQALAPCVAFVICSTAWVNGCDKWAMLRTFISTCQELIYAYCAYIQHIVAYLFCLTICKFYFPHNIRGMHVLLLYPPFVQHDLFAASFVIDHIIPAFVAKHNKRHIPWLEGESDRYQELWEASSDQDARQTSVASVI